VDLKRALKDLQQRGAPAPNSEGARQPVAPLIEIFHSIQGEGRFVGVPMVFLRTATCPLRCLYCDTPHSYAAQAKFPVRLSVREQQESNPVTSARAAELVKLAAGPDGRGARGQRGATARRVSITGGEPLVFPEFVRELGRAVREQGMRVHLETAAVHPEALAECVQQIDHLSADYKLPETLGAPADGTLTLAPGASFGQRHVQCCEIAIRRGATVDVKIVLTDRIGDPNFERALEDLAPLREKILLVLQPATPFGAVSRTVARPELERFTAAAVSAGFDVRVLPQVHKVLQVP
jgi:organic radical activating enzyme